MYLVVALAVTILVIVLAWRGIGTARGDDGMSASHPTRRPPRPPRMIAPDDDPEFLSEIDRRLRGEDKSG